MLYRISVTERGLTGIANIFRSRLSRLDDLLGAGTVPLTFGVVLLDGTKQFSDTYIQGWACTYEYGVEVRQNLWTPNKQVITYQLPHLFPPSVMHNVRPSPQS